MQAAQIKRRVFIAGLAAAALLALGGTAAGSAEAATVVTVNPTTTVGSNAFPFGQGTVWTPQAGFVYKNIPAFNLKAGDTIAFDLGATNDVNIQLKIEMAPTTVNGGDVAGTFTNVVPSSQVPLNPKGDNVAGNFELQFTAIAPFNFPGGGLIIRFSSPAGAFASDISPQGTLTNTASSADASGFFVKRFITDADGLSPYSTEDNLFIGGFRLTIADPAVTATPTTQPTPATTAPVTKKKCKKKHKRAAAAKKCRKKRK